MNEREKALRHVIDELFVIICKKCTPEEIQEIPCLKDLQMLSKEEEE